MAILSIYTDGSSHAKGGLPIGYAFVAAIGDVVIDTGTGGHVSGTNNVAEISAAIMGIEWAAKHYHDKNGSPLIELVSDSMLVLGLASGVYKPTKNVELAKKLHDLFNKYCWRTRWVRGHSGDKMNEMCDELAKSAKNTYKLKAEEDRTKVTVEESAPE